MEAITDKMDVEATIGGQTIGWQLNRATAGLGANKSHLEAAQRLLQEFEESDINKVLAPALYKRDNAIEASKQALIVATRKRDNAIEAAEQALLLVTTKSGIAIDTANKEYEHAARKVSVKTDAQHKLLQARVKRYEEAVKLSTQSVAQLQQNKPRGLIRVEGAAKKIERELRTVDEIASMNKQQEASRDKPVDVTNMPKWLEEIGEDKDLEELRADARKDVADRLRREQEEYERKKEEAAKQRRIMLAAEEQRLTDNRQKELEALRLQALEAKGKTAGVIDDKIFRLEAVEDAMRKQVEDENELEEFRRRDMEEERRYREENNSDDESEDEEELQRQIELAKEKQRIYLNNTSIVKKIEINTTIDKKPIRRVAVR